MPLTLQGLTSLFAPRVSPTEGSRAFSQSMAGIRDQQRIDEQKRAAVVREFQADQQLAQAKADYEERVRSAKSSEEISRAYNDLLKAQNQVNAVKDMISLGAAGQEEAMGALGAPMGIDVDYVPPGMAPPVPEPVTAVPEPATTPEPVQQPGNLGVTEGPVPKVPLTPQQPPDMEFTPEEAERGMAAQNIEPLLPMLNDIIGDRPDMEFTLDEAEVPLPPAEEEVADVVPRSTSELSNAQFLASQNQEQPAVVSQRQPGYRFSTGGGPINFEAMRQRAREQWVEFAEKLQASGQPHHRAVWNQLQDVAPNLADMGVGPKEALSNLTNPQIRGIDAARAAASARRSSRERFDLREGRMEADRAFRKADTLAKRNRWYTAAQSYRDFDKAFRALENDRDNSNLWAATLTTMARALGEMRLTNEDIERAAGKDTASLVKNIGQATNQVMTGGASEKFYKDTMNAIVKMRGVMEERSYDNYLRLKDFRDRYRHNPAAWDEVDSIIDSTFGDMPFAAEAMAQDDPPPRGQQQPSRSRSGSKSQSSSESGAAAFTLDELEAMPVQNDGRR